MRTIRGLVIGYAVIGFLASLPILSIAIAGTIAEWNGCTLHEGFVNPCIVNGSDVGKTLYTMGMMGFFAIATIPLGIILGVAWSILWVVWYMRRGRRPALPTG